ncbi:MAG TPA: flagellar basal body P-ring formation chaperone FlgA [Candidatus Angelobacter sp.]|nr:flagellar basal body P-ring formation chaperone FlgA [Candidatus Angelobacter sp.]
MTFIFLALAGCLAALPLRAETATNSPTERAIDQAELTTLLTAKLQKDYVKEKGELELKITQPWAARKISDEPITVNILEMPTMGVSMSFIVRFELRNEHGSLGNWQVPVQAHIWRNVWVAHSMLNRGDSLADADIAQERRDMLLIHEPLAEFAERDPSLQIAEPVGVGAPLFARSIRLAPVIHRGQMVDALIQEGSFSVATKVEVLEDGAPGQIVRARNPQSLRNIRGKVLNEQSILVSL